MFVYEAFFNAIYDRELAPRIRREFCDFSKSMQRFFSLLHRDFRTALHSISRLFVQSSDYNSCAIALSKHLCYISLYRKFLISLQWGKIIMQKKKAVSAQARTGDLSRVRRT